MISPSLCYDCPLPDCDESSPTCPLKAASRRYMNAYRRGEAIPDDVRLGRKEYAAAWKQEKRAKLSEAAP